MIGGNVIDDNFKKIIVEKQLDNICQILDGEVKYYTCCDRTDEHQKIVIEYISCFQTIIIKKISAIL